MKNVRMILWLALAGTFGCREPVIKDKLWQCSNHDECGPGYLCNSTQSYCEAADDGVNGVFSDKLVVAIVASITSGGAQNLGQGMVAGIQAYFTHVNSLGGVNGRKLELKAVDDGYDPLITPVKVAELTDGPNRQAFALLGNVGTPTATAALPIAVTKNKTIFFGAFTGAGILREDPPSRYVFNYRASYKQETEQLVKYFTATRSPKVPPGNIGVLAQGTNADGVTMDGYGRSGFDGVVSALKPQGIDMSTILVATYERNTKNIGIAESKFLAWLGDKGCPAGEANCHAMTRSCPTPKPVAAVVMVPTYLAASAFVQQINKQMASAKTNGIVSGLTLTPDQIYGLGCVDVVFSSVSFVGSDGLAGDLNAAGTYSPGGGAPSRLFCDGVIVSQVVPHWNTSAEAPALYRTHLAAFDPNVVPGFVSFEGYLAAQLFVEGVKARGKDINTESMVDSLESLSNLEFGIGTTLGFSKNNHQASQKVWGTVLQKTTSGPTAGTKCDFVTLDL